MAITAQQDRLLAIIAGALNRDPRALPEPMDVKLAEQLEADSLDAVEIAMEIESQFAIEISDDEIDKIGARDSGATPGDWWRLIEPKLGEG